MIWVLGRTASRGATSRQAAAVFWLRAGGMGAAGPFGTNGEADDVGTPSAIGLKRDLSWCLAFGCLRCLSPGAIEAVIDGFKAVPGRAAARLTGQFCPVTRFLAAPNRTGLFGAA